MIIYCGSYNSTVIDKDSIEPAMIYLVYLLSQLPSSPIRISEEKTYFVNIKVPAPLRANQSFQTNLSLLSRHPSNEPALFMFESDADYFDRACRVSYLVLIHISVLFIFL